MKTRFFLSILVTGLVANMLLVSVAHAYLDPGTGSALLQGLLAALAAIVITAKLYWHRLLRLFGIRKAIKKPEQTSTPTKQESTKDN